MIILQNKRQKNNQNWPKIPDHSYRILIIGGSGSRKANALFNMIGHQPDIYKISLYTQDSYEAKYQLLINICEGVSLKEYKNSKAFLVYLNDIEGST